MEQLPVIKLQDFHFSANLLAFQPRIYKGQEYTVVTEMEREYIVFASTRRVVAKCCTQFGTTVKSASKLSKDITFGNNKLPLALGTAEQPFILIPSLSPSKGYTMWLFYHAIKSYTPGMQFCCDVQLINNEKITVNTSSASFSMQHSRAALVDRYFRTLTSFDTIPALNHPNIKKIPISLLQEP